MNKYFSKLNPDELLGRKIYSDIGEEYVIIYAKFHNKGYKHKEAGLEIFFANEKDAKKDELHELGLSNLKLQLEKGNTNFNEDDNNIWRVRFANMYIYNPLLRSSENSKSYRKAGEKRADFDWYVRSDNDSFNIYYQNDYYEADEIPTADEVLQCCYQDKGLVGGMRKIFKCIFGAGYANEIRDYYIKNAIANIDRQIEIEKNNYEMAARTLNMLAKHRADLCAEGGIKVFDDDDDEEELSSIDDKQTSVDDEQKLKNDQSIDSDDYINLDDLFMD